MTAKRLYIILRLLGIILSISLFVTVMSSTAPGATYFQVFWKTFVLLSLCVNAIILIYSFDSP